MAWVGSSKSRSHSIISSKKTGWSTMHGSPALLPDYFVSVSSILLTRYIARPSAETESILEIILWICNAWKDALAVWETVCRIQFMRPRPLCAAGNYERKRPLTRPLPAHPSKRADLQLADSLTEKWEVATRSVKMIKFEGAIGSTLVQYVTHTSAPTRVVEGRMNMKVSRRDDTCLLYTSPSPRD